MAKLDTTVQEEVTGMIEPVSDGETGNGLLFGSAALKVKDKAPGRILNLNDFPMTLKTGWL